MLQKKHLCMALIFTLTSLSAAHASLLSLGGSWQLDGEVWSGQLQLPDWEENLLGIEEPPQVSNPSWTQKLNLGFSWQSQEGTGFGLELMDAGNWGVGYASDGSWGRQSTFGPLLIHEAFGYHDGGPGNCEPADSSQTGTTPFWEEPLLPWKAWREAGRLGNSGFQEEPSGSALCIGQAQILWSQGIHYSASL